MDFFFKLVPLEAAEVALVGDFGELVQRLDLERQLNLLDGVAVGRGRDAEAVPGEGGVARVEGAGDVRVVVAGKGVVPVGAVEADAVGEDLEGGGGAGLGVADCGGEGVVFGDGGRVLQKRQSIAPRQQQEKMWGRRMWCRG